MPWLLLVCCPHARCLACAGSRPARRGLGMSLRMPGGACLACASSCPDRAPTTDPSGDSNRLPPSGVSTFPPSGDPHRPPSVFFHTSAPTPTHFSSFLPFPSFFRGHSRPPYPSFPSSSAAFPISAGTRAPPLLPFLPLRRPHCPPPLVPAGMMHRGPTLGFAVTAYFTPGDVARGVVPVPVCRGWEK